MYASQRKGATFSVVLHLAGLAWLVFATFFWSGFSSNDDETVIFEMMPGPASPHDIPGPKAPGPVDGKKPGAPAASPEESAAADIPDLSMPDIPDAPVVAQPEPAAPPPPPAPAPTPKQQTPAPKKPKAEEPKRISYADFLKTRAGRRVAERSSTASRTPTRATGKGTRVKIDTSGIRKGLSQIVMEGGEGGGGGGAADSTGVGVRGGGGGTGGELARYLGRLRTRIDANWEKPDDAESYGRSVTIAFTVGRNGSVASRSVKKSSGSRTFDQSVLNAFDRLGYVGVPPGGGEGKTFLVTFNLEDA